MPSATESAMKNSPEAPLITLNDASAAMSSLPEIATLREGRPRSITQAMSSTSTAAKHRMSVSRSPVRSPAPPAVPGLSQSQRLRQPFYSSHQQRRTSLAGIDTADMSSSIGMPYAYQHTPISASGPSAGSLSPDSSTFPVSASAFPPSNIAPRQQVLSSTVSISTRSSPRASVSSLDTNYTSHSAQLRRHSESTHRRPTTAEVFDLMEREQDAIVLKLMREIQQLKEDNRSLLQTINMLTNPSSSTASASTSRASFSRSRRPSSVVSPEDALDFSKATLRADVGSPERTPRSMFVGRRDSAGFVSLDGGVAAQREIHREVMK